jgi:hypothetical protein
MSWIPITRAVQELNVSIKTLRRWIKAGVYPSKLINGLCCVELETPEDRPRKATKKSRNYILNILFNLSGLKTFCFEYLEGEKIFGHLWSSIPSAEGRPREKDWKRLYLIINAYCNGVEKRWKDRSFDEDFFFKMYQDMQVIKDMWAQHTSWYSPDNMETEEKDLVDKEALALIDKIRDDIEKLLFELT